MNERIRELWDEAAADTAAYPSGQNNSWETQVNFMDRFAELLVKECCFIGEQWADGLFDSKQYAFVNKQIKRHFGVEE
jgi:hypothetical protein